MSRDSKITCHHIYFVQHLTRLVQVQTFSYANFVSLIVEFGLGCVKA